jgi:hypothetical protein
VDGRDVVEVLSDGLVAGPPRAADLGVGVRIDEQTSKRAAAVRRDGLGAVVRGVGVRLPDLVAELANSSMTIVSWIIFSASASYLGGAI